MGSLPERAGRRCNQVLNPLHAAHYFSPEAGAEMTALGLDGWSAGYFAMRSAALGEVGSATVTAAFYVFSPALVAAHLPAAWRAAAPEAVLAARLRAADGALRRLLGDGTVASPEMAEAAGLALRAAEGCAPHGRALAAAHAALPVPDAPHLALWHAATVLREHRGDGHLAVLLDLGLDPVEAMVSHTATGKGMTPRWNTTTRGWEDTDWKAAVERLRARGLLAADGELTDRGRALRAELEERTDRLDLAPYELLGAAGTARLTELAGGFTRTALAAGAFPAEAFGKG
ncbi:SCO6745 family protein [Streptomyces sp. JNUCC 64]